MKYFKLIIILLISVSALAQNYRVGDTLNVVAINGLSLRVEPTVNSEKKLVLQAGDQVQILEKQFRLDTIFSFKGSWVWVNTMQGDTGYVFDAFISTLPMAGVSSMKAEMGNKIETGYAGLQKALSDYALNNFHTSCSLTYRNSYDGESTHAMEIYDLEGGHKLIEHQYWEGGASELQFKNVRLSEIYYLVHQLTAHLDTIKFPINDYELRNPKPSHAYNRCIAMTDIGCYIQLAHHQSENSFFLYFNAPCC